MRSDQAEGPLQPRLGLQPAPDGRWSQELADLEGGTSRVFPSIFQTKANDFSESISTVTENQVCVASRFRHRAGISAWFPHKHSPFLLQCREGLSPWVPSSNKHRDRGGKFCFGLSPGSMWPKTQHCLPGPFLSWAPRPQPSAWA